MSVNLTCPKSNRHKWFSVTAHIAQEWQVDSQGQFVKVLSDCTDVVHKPNAEDYYVCLICGTQAKVTKE